MSSSRLLLDSDDFVESESESEIDEEKITPYTPVHFQRRRRVACVLGLGLVLLLSISVVFGAGFYWGQLERIAAPSSHTTGNPRIRREWRTLSDGEKRTYIEAVQCLKTRPSRLGLNQTLYDDFPWVHYRVGGYSHGSAAFLAWHRYFLHVYHGALRDDCGYQGELTYWDWTLDAKDIPGAPVWDDNVGFGGNGHDSLGERIMNGYCVDNGPFANWNILYLDSDYTPHCLSRGFQTGERLHELSQALGPQAVSKLFNENTYERFNLALERQAHNSIPHIVRGDFDLLTAPSDPVFILHHTQLDRLWWQWQHQHWATRRSTYNGRAHHNSTDLANIEDTIPMGGLAPDIRVKDIMDTENGLLWYGY